MAAGAGGYSIDMRPLLFVNWAAVNARFTTLMWLVALVLGFVVLTHLLPSSGAPVAHHLAAAHGSLSGPH